MLRERGLSQGPLDLRVETQRRTSLNGQAVDGKSPSG